MSKENKEDRRRFLFKLVRGGAFLALGSAIIGGGCKCGEEDPSWSDDKSEGDDTPTDRQDPPPPPPDEEKKDEGGAEDAEEAKEEKPS